MTQRSVGVVLLAVAAAAFVASSCGGGTAVKPASKAQGSIAGVVFKAPVARATVTAFRADAKLVRGEVLATATTADDGTFSLSLPPYGGPVIVTATGGTYTEEAIGLGVQLSGELATLVPDYASGSKVEGLRLHPVSTWALAAASFHAAQGTSLAEAWTAASAHVGGHMGGVPWESIAPVDVTKSATLAPEGRAALLLGALSQEGVSIALASKLSPGLTVNAGTLTQALADDLLADGTWDGVGTAGALSQGAQGLTGQTMRLALSQGLLDFVRSPQNGTGLKEADVHSLAADLANAADPYLFCAHQDAAQCAAGGSDIDAPAITFTAPADNAVARGSIAIAVSAADASEVKSFAFLAPAALTSTASVIAADKHTAALTAVFDVSALPDGDVTVQVRAADQFGNSATKSLKIRVSNHGPSVAVSAPSAGTSVHGVITLTATATANGADVVALTLVSPPAGVSADSDPTAASFVAQWDTAQVQEGPLTLRFLATDANGGQGEASVAVTVDNLPLGVVNAGVWAGQPLAGAQVRLLAIDPRTGAPATGLDAGPVLGVATMPTDADGGVSFTLSQENYVGPVQLEASGVALSVTDPSDGLTPIAVPGAFKLTSYVANYRSGDVLSVHATLWTTVADAAAQAAATGKADAGVAGLPAAMAVTDALMAGHISRPTNWNLRTVRPVSLTAGPQSLRDAVYAAMPDVALHQLARDLSSAGQLTPGGVVTAFTLAQQLAQDVGDGLFDGKAGTTQLSVSGTPSYDLDANTTRFKLASALDAFIRGSTNKTGLKRSDVQPAGVFNAITNDAPPSNFLYPAAVAPLPFDATPPTSTFALTFTNGPVTAAAPVGIANVVGGALTIAVDATDLSDMQSLSVTLAGATLQLQPGNSATHFAAIVDTTALADGAYTAVAHACDKVNNCGDTGVSVVVDNTAPATTFTAPAAGYYNTSVSVDSASTDAHGVASAIVTSLAGFTDTDPSAERVQGTWTFPTAQPEGPLAVTVKACDAVGNCGTKTSSAAIVDKTPPAVTFAVSYVLGTGPGLLPVGATKALGGTMSQAADATDPAGVASLVVTCAGATLVPAASGNTAAHVVSSLVTTALADGQRTLSAHACDAAGNCGDTTTTFTIDNTPPAVTVVSPAATGFVSASFALEATATDTTAVASLAASAPAGLVDQDAAVARVFIPSTAWTLTAADGPLPVAFLGCDAVGNCRTAAAPTMTVDRTPPVVAITSTPPAYTNAASITLSGTVSDGAGAGVKRVLVQVGTNPLVVATVTGSSWTAPVTLGRGFNAISVWGEDLAAPVNGSPLAGAPYVGTVTVSQDVGAPTVQPRSPVSYRDERGLYVNTAPGTGVPVLPVVYNYTTAAAAVNEGGTVFKIRSKSSLADTNTPFLRWAVAQEALPAAPVSSGSWVLSSVNGSICPFTGCASGLLRTSAATEAGYVLYELPLSSAISTTPGVWSFVVSFTDAAGNTTQRTFNVTYRLVGAPIVMVRDDQYATYGDPSSLAASLSMAQYAALIGTTKRITRWLVYNPNAETVWVSNSLTGVSSSWSETWTERRDGAGSGACNDDGQAWSATNLWTSEPPPSVAYPCNNTGYPYAGVKPFPCDYTTKPVHYLGDTATYVRCEARTEHEVNQTTGPYSLVNSVPVTAGLQAKLYPSATGGEVIAAPAVSFGTYAGWSIAPAAGTALGSLVVYATATTPARPASGLLASVFPLSAGIPTFRVGWLYDLSQTGAESACLSCYGIGCFTFYGIWTNALWTRYDLWRDLWSRSIAISGSLALVTNPDVVVTGGTSPSTWSNLPFTFTF